MSTSKITFAALVLLLASGCASSATQMPPAAAGFGPTASAFAITPRPTEPERDELVTVHHPLGEDEHALPAPPSRPMPPKPLFASRTVSRVRTSDCSLCRGSVN
jgi:hypothetical protein